MTILSHRIVRYFLLALSLVLATYACNEEDPSSTSTRLRVKLTDAAAPTIKEFIVDIEGIEIFLKDSADVEGEWFILDFPGKTYNILQLMNGKTVQLIDQYVPAGTILKSVKLHFGENNKLIPVTGIDDMISLEIPEELKDGLILDVEETELRTYTIASIVIDLNAALSVVIDSKGNYIFNPKGRVFPETFGGKLKGYVAPLTESNPIVAIIQGSDTLLSIPELETDGDNIGMFLFSGLREGDWEVHLIADAESGYQDTLLIDSVVAGKETVLNPNPVWLKIPSSE